jgi:tetratricopeptide (TPR) repeat protein
VAAELTGPAAYGHHGMAGVPAAITRGYLAWGLTELGQFEEALRWAGEGMDIARETNSAMSQIWVTDYLALTCLRQGEIERTLDLLQPNLELCRRAEVRLLLSLTCGLLGLAYSAAGRCSDAIPLLEEAVSADSLHHHPEGSGYPFVWLAQGYARAGRCAEARDAVARALATARTQGERGHEAWARFTEAQIETVAGAPIATVAGRYRRAHALAGRCGMAPLVQLCRAALER